MGPQAGKQDDRKNMLQQCTHTLRSAMQQCSSLRMEDWDGTLSRSDSRGKLYK